MSSDTFYVIGENTLEDISDSIKTKKGYLTETRIAVKDFASEIDGISGTIDQLINPDTPNGSVEIHSGTEKIADSFCQSNPIFKNKIGGDCTFPNAISIGANGFRQCIGITSIDAPNATSVGQYGFSEMTGITTLNLPKVSTTNGYFCNNDTSLVSVTLAPNVVLGGFAFDGCINLSRINSEEDGIVNLPNAPVGGMGQIFRNCKKLKQVILSSATATYCADAFNGCDLLETVDYGKGTFVGQTTGLRAFTNCPNLKAIILRSPTKFSYYSGAYTDADARAKITIYVPSTVLNDYLADTNWTGAGFAGIEAIADTFTIDGTTYNCADGETFTSWISSANNTIGAHLIGDTVFNSDNTAYLSKNNKAIIQSDVVSGEYAWTSL